MKSTLFWRKTIQPEIIRICSMVTGQRVNEGHLVTLAHTLKKEQKKQILIHEEDGIDKQDLQITISLMSIFLLTHGDKASSIDILDGIYLYKSKTPKPKVAFLLSQSLSAILPLPHGLRPIEQLDEVRAWITTNIHQLQWNMSTETYTFGDEEKRDEPLVKQ